MAYQIAVDARELMLKTPAERLRIVGNDGTDDVLSHYGRVSRASQLLGDDTIPLGEYLGFRELADPETVRRAERIALLYGNIQRTGDPMDYDEFDTQIVARHPAKYTPVERALAKELALDGCRFDEFGLAFINADSETEMRAVARRVKPRHDDTPYAQQRALRSAGNHARLRERTERMITRMLDDMDRPEDEYPASYSDSS